MLAGGLGWLAAGPAAAAPAGWTPQIHQATRNTRLGPVGRRWWPETPVRGRSKPYSGVARFALPEPSSRSERSFREVLAGEPGVARSIFLPELARLLHSANGVTGRGGLRAAPSAGALYAGEIYVVVERVTGLAPGVYYYSPLERSLVPVREEASLGVLAESVERPGQIEGAAAAVLLTNVFRRYGWRYANRGYRYALIDTGHIGENLRLAAGSAGFTHVAPARFWDDRVNALLRLDGRTEAVCALHVVGAAGAGEATRVLVPVAADTERGKPTVRYHRASRLEPGEGRAFGGRTRVRELQKDGLRPTASVEECIRLRRSARAYRDRPIGRDQLEWIVDAAGIRSGHVELLIAVHRVLGLAPGLYRIDATEGLAAARPGDLREELVATCLAQDKAGSCAAALFGVGRLREAAREGGDRSYRDLLIESGAIGQRIYLAAEAVGLAARNLAAFRDDDLNRLLALDGDERAVLHLTLIGHEA